MGGLRWAMAVSLVASAVMSAPTIAQRSNARAPARGVAAPVPLQVTVAGVRVVREGAGAQGRELRAFNEPPGTDLDVLVRTGTPAEFIVDVNHAQSVVESFSDNAGRAIGARVDVGQYPKVAADGSAALVSLSSDAVPPAGATSVTVSGQLAITTSNTSAMQRIPGVRIASGQTFRLGTATITINDVVSDRQRTSFTLRMTRATKHLVRAMVFRSPTGEPLNVSARGFMVMNDKAELPHVGPPELKTATIEVDVWQNLWSRKVPFRVTATLGGGS